MKAPAKQSNPRSLVLSMRVTTLLPLSCDAACSLPAVEACQLLKPGRLQAVSQDSGNSVVTRMLKTRLLSQ